MSKRVWRAGVRFDCPDCGLLWRDDDEHAELHADRCPSCDGQLRLVGKGEQVVEWASGFAAVPAALCICGVDAKASADKAPHGL